MWKCIRIIIVNKRENKFKKQNVKKKNLATYSCRKNNFVTVFILFLLFKTDFPSSYLKLCLFCVVCALQISIKNQISILMIKCKHDEFLLLRFYYRKNYYIGFSFAVNKRVFNEHIIFTVLFVFNI